MSDTKISALPSATIPLAGTEVLPVVQGGVTEKVSVADLTAGRSVAMGSATITSDLVVDTTTLYADSVNNAVGFGTASPQEAVHVYGASAGVMRLGTASRAYNIFANNSDGALYIRDVTGGTNRVALSSAGNVTLSTGNLVQGTAAKGIDFTANSSLAGKTSQLLNYYEEGTYTPVFTTSGGGQSVTHLYQSGQYTRIGRMVNFAVLIGTSAFTGGSGSIRVSLPFTAYNGTEQAVCTSDASGWVTNAPSSGYIGGNTAYLILSRINGAANTDITTANITTGSTGNIICITGCYMAA